ncbi:MAG: DNA replication protein [Rhodospirillaceae bacterium]|nr:MAG: DNA replication protein [Rhodospirillaceae bacterium]
MTAGRQLILDLGHRPAFGRDDFLVSAANQEAVEWIDRYPSWSGYGLALVGPAGSGKTHLAQVFARATGAVVLSAASLAVAGIGAVTAANHVVVVDYDGTVFDERALLHLLNAIKERDGHVLVTSREAPARWGVSLADLHSRLSVLPVVRIAAPDDVLLEAVLIKLFADRQLTVAPDVVAYALRHMDRSFAALRAIVARADAESLAGQRAVTVPLIKSLLGTNI